MQQNIKTLFEGIRKIQEALEKIAGKRGFHVNCTKEIRGLDKKFRPKGLEYKFFKKKIC